MYLKTSRSLDGFGSGSNRTVSLSFSIYTSSLLRRPFLFVPDPRLAFELPPELSTTLTSSTLVVGGDDGAAGGVKGAGGLGPSGDDGSGGAAVNSNGLGGVTVLIKGGRDDRGPWTYCTAGFRSQTTVSEMRVRVGRPVAT